MIKHDWVQKMSIEQQWRRCIGKANLNSGVKFYRDQPFPLSSCAILIWSPILAKLRFSLVAQLSGTLWVTLISLQLLLLNLFALFHKVNFFKNKLLFKQPLVHECMDVNFGPFPLYFSLKCATSLSGWVE
jgi:hypothetical protein